MQKEGGKQRKNKEEGGKFALTREKTRKSRLRGLQSVHVIEGMIQLLAGSLVFQLLIVQFICTSLSRGSRWRKREARADRKEEIRREEKREI